MKDYCLLYRRFKLKDEETIAAEAEEAAEKQRTCSVCEEKGHGVRTCPVMDKGEGNNNNNNNSRI